MGLAYGCFCEQQTQAPCEDPQVLLRSNGGEVGTRERFRFGTLLESNRTTETNSEVHEYKQRHRLGMVWCLGSTEEVVHLPLEWQRKSECISEEDPEINEDAFQKKDWSTSKFGHFKG